jgi:CPA2 family monovalent cation:H+ antiporter-2
MSLDLSFLFARWQWVALAVIGVVVVKALVTTLLLRFGGIPRGLATETGLLMGSPSETTLIVLTAALQAKLIDENTAAFWQVVTAIGLTITPLLARIGHDVARRMEHGDALDQDVALSAGTRTIIVGFGRVGRMVADMLDVHGAAWVALEGNVDTVAEARREGKPVRFGDAARPQLLETLDLDRAEAVVLTMDHPAQLVRLTRWLRKRHPDLTIIARARDTDHAAQLYKAGASDAVPDTLEASLQLSEAVLVDLGKAMGPVIASIHEKRDELRAAIKADADLEDKPRLGPLKG